ncbi:histidine kinase [Prolixibacteraceae bacterium Z1-6]|uniref:Histidine kinase n=1 Tax=Draconibacterium aestuarii TaxID=2998507 RepID=A0A9X3FDH7_9BACT|nr:histidine kinase [Prolixibacteraceae bacterium Z1-6]
MKKSYILLLLISFLLQHALAQNPFVTNYSISDGLPTSKGNCAFQDSKGFMWFGTDAGVSRFDGNQFVHYTEEDGLSGNLVIRIKEDKKGQIWFLNLNGTVNYYSNGIIYNDNNAPFLAELKTNFLFHNFFEDTDSTLYFYNTASEIYVVKNNKYIDYQNLKNNDAHLSRSTYALNMSSDGHLLLWASDGILELENIDNITKHHRETGLIHKAFPLDKNKTLILDQFGSIHLFQDTEPIQKNILTSESQTINDIIIDNEGFIWISTFDKGIFCYQNEKLVAHLDIRKSQNLIVDNENNIWTASNFDGIYKINRNILKYEHIGLEEFDNKGITDIAPANNKGVWVTNGESLFWIHNQKKFGRKIPVEGHILESIYQLKNNTVILSGSNTNINFIEEVKVNEQKNIIEHVEPWKSGYNVKKVVVDSSENKLYSFANDRLITCDLKSPYTTSFPPLNIGRINNLFINNKNLVVIKGSRFTVTDGDSTYNNAIYQQFSDQILTSHLNLDKQNEILNIYGNNLYLIHNEQTYNLTKDLKTQIDYRIKDMVYSENTLFFFTVKTVYFITNPLDYLTTGQVELNRLNIEFNNINDILCQDSLLYVASDDGLTFIPIKESVNSQPQETQPYFTKVSLNDEELSLLENKVVFKNKNRLSIEFSSLNYSSIPSEYSYKMKGLDDNWSNGRETRVVYLNLEPGEYTFQLKSHKNREPFSEVIELPVIVNPTFFQRTSTKVLLLFLTLFFLFLIVRFFYQRKIQQKETDHLLITLEHKALQSMMNPHFIFNALGSIQGYLLQNKSSEAGTYLSQFARLIRQNMNSLKSNYICIDDEIERLRNYIALEKLRSNNRFEYEIIVDEELDSYEACIPSMIIQPFVENAIWHGISPLYEGGKIKVIFNYLDEKSVEVLVEDNGVGIKNEDSISNPSHGLNMGITLTKKRLKLIGERQGVKSTIFTSNLFPEEEFPGTQIKIIIPLVEAKL